jgi:hypothetical protein
VSPAAPTGTRHRIVLVRDWHDHHGAGGCCGNADAIKGLLTDRSQDPADEVCVPGPAERTGAVYRALRTALPDVELTVADSRNWLWLVPSTYRALRRAGRDRAHSMTAAARATTPGAVLVDGTALTLPDDPSPDLVVRAAGTAMGRSGGTLPG